jgi:2-oxoglutarate dehydrogenase E2 component (dihydrolipoamide succinyltransferase)
MNGAVRIPALAESITEAVLVEWLKQDGEAVKVDEPIATLETDKAAVEIAADRAGVLKHRKHAGDRVRVGDVIATIDPAGVPARPQPEAPARSPEPPRPAAAAPPANGGLPVAQPGLGAAAPALSPAVRRMVEQHGLDPRAIPASGRDGRLLKEDVLRHLETDADREGAARSQAPRSAPPAGAGPAPAAAPAAPRPTPVHAAADAVKTTSGLIAWDPGEAERAVPMSRIRVRIAEKLVQAQQTAAILTTFNEIDMTEILALRARFKESFERKHGVRLGFMSFFARASILALHEVPEINAEIRGTDIVYRRHVHLGVAVGTDRGLVVPVVKQAERLDFAGIEREIARLAGRARDGALTLDELSGGTFTISNGGVYGSLLSTPILNPPQSGILGMHKIEKRAVVGPDDEIRARPMMYVALSYDHRIVDGEQAVTFLVRVKERLEDPERMLLDV